MDIIIKPDQDLMARLVVNSRIKYQPVAEFKIYGGREIIEEGELRVTPKFSLSAQEAFEGYLAAGPDFASKASIFTYDDFIFSQLTERILKEYEAKLPVRIRGTAVNIGEPFTLPGGSYVRSIEEVLREGAEMGEDPNQTLFEKDFPELNHRSRQWAVQTTYNLRRESQNNAFLFPAILVYDSNLFQKNSIALPSSAENRAKVLLAIYVLDYIKSPRDIISA